VRTFEFRVEIYGFNIDYVGHVNNAVYVQWTEIGRSKFLEEVGLGVERLAESGIAPILVSTEIVYKHPLFLGDQVRIAMWLSQIRRASVQIEFRFYSGEGVLAAAASQRGAFVHRDTGRPARLPRELWAGLEPYLGPREE
jgi:acyl-CoA thioester hydrolase